MNRQSDFVTPHLVNTSETTTYGPSKGSPTSVQLVNSNNVNNNGTIYVPNTAAYRFINASSLSSSSIPSFNLNTNNLSYNQSFVSPSVPHFSTHQDISLSSSSSSTSSSSSSTSSSSSSSSSSSASSNNQMGVALAKIIPIPKNTANNHSPPVTIMNSNFQQYITNQKNLVNQTIEALRRAQLKLIAFDFDCTIVNVHTGGQWIDTAEKLAEYVRPCFRELLAALLKCPDFFVCVVTYSPQEDLIREVLRISLQEYNLNDLINKMVIKGNTREFIEEHGIENCYSNGKQIHLEYCRSVFESTKRVNKETNRIDNENVLLLDDDTQNLKVAHENGHYVFQVTNSCQLTDFFKFLKETFD